jgi:hypothetical protein
VSAAMQPGRSKTLVVTLQQQSNDSACYVVPRVTTAAPAFDKTAPLAVALLRKGLSEQQIVQDGWTALMSLPLEAVVAIMAATFLDTMKPTLEKYATHDVVKVKPSSARSAELWCQVVMRFAYVKNGAQILGTVAMRDALVEVSPQLGTPGACFLWCTAICYLTLSAGSRQLFGTAAVRDALVALSAQATTATPACQTWCAAVSNLAFHDANKALFGTAAVRDALVAVHPQATTADACRWWCGAICDLTDTNDANTHLFGTAAVRDALVALSPHATTAAGYWWCTAICILGPSNKTVMCVPAVRDAHAALKRISADSAEATKRWDEAAAILCSQGGAPAGAAAAAAAAAASN